MTLNEIRERVAEIGSLVDDCESQHSHKDKLYLDVLKAIAGDNKELPKKLARAALKVENIDFEEWCG